HLDLADVHRRERAIGLEEGAVGAAVLAEVAVAVTVHVLLDHGADRRAVAVHREGLGLADGDWASEFRSRAAGAVESFARSVKAEYGALLDRDARRVLGQFRGFAERLDRALGDLGVFAVTEGAKDAELLGEAAQARFDADGPADDHPGVLLCQRRVGRPFFRR